MHPSFTPRSLFIDEKIQTQRRDRIQSGVLLESSPSGTVSHDETRHSTTLLAALGTLDGAMIL